MNYWVAEPLEPFRSAMSRSSPRWRTSASRAGAWRRPITVRTAGSSTTTSTSGAGRRRSTPPITAFGPPAGVGFASISGSATCTPAIRSGSAKTAYSLMRDAALFHADTLVEHPTKDILVSGPSNSPERGGLVMGPTMDHQIIRDLFAAVISASEILDTDAALRERLRKLRAKIAPQRGRHGRPTQGMGRQGGPPYESPSRLIPVGPSSRV